MGILCTSKHLKPGHVNLNFDICIAYFHEKGKQNERKYLSFLFYSLLEINELKLSYQSRQGLSISREEDAQTVQDLWKDSAVVMVSVSKTRL